MPLWCASSSLANRTIILIRRKIANLSYPPPKKIKEPSIEIAVISGNGPSLADIDYSLLPQNFDLFRCNQFYFEDRYFLGKDIEFAFFNPGNFFEQYYTATNLNLNNEYNIKNIVCSTYSLYHLDNPRFLDTFYNVFPEAIKGIDVLRNLTKFRTFINYNEIYNKKRITASVYMVAFAIAMRYKKIYLAGIDFYENGSNYAFDTMQNNLLKIVPQFKKKNSKNIAHSKDFDLMALNFLEKTYGVKIYTISKNSTLNKYFATPPSSNSSFTVALKPKDYIKDIMIPSEYSYFIYEYNTKDIETIRLANVVKKYSIIYHIGRLGTSLKSKPQKIKRWFKRQFS